METIEFNTTNTNLLRSTVRSAKIALAFMGIIFGLRAQIGCTEKQELQDPIAICDPSQNSDLTRNEQLRILCADRNNMTDAMIDLRDEIKELKQKLNAKKDLEKDKIDLENQVTRLQERITSLETTLQNDPRKYTEKDKLELEKYKVAIEEIVSLSQNVTYDNCKTRRNKIIEIIQHL